MTSDDVLAALGPVMRALKELGVGFYIGGSVASSIHGLPRTTLDVDLIADLRPGHVGPLVERLAHGYYLDSEAARRAIVARSSFNLIHLATLIKIDVFVPDEAPFDRSAMKRASAVDSGLSEVELPLASVEDTVLHKLHWYRLGGGASERQWSDILGMLKVQVRRIDRAYLTTWAAALDVSDLLIEALGEAGIDPEEPSS